MTHRKLTLLILGSTLLGFGCSSNNSTDASKPSTVIGEFSTALGSVGTQMQSSSLTGALMASPIHALTEVDEVCDENGSPMDGGDFMDQNDAEYPARVFYCKIAKDTGSPESIPGAYGQTKSIACALENAGIVYDGVEHEATVEINSDCFSEVELADDEMPESLDITYTATQPAAFNPHFQSGIVMTVPDFGTFSLAASVEDSMIKFMGYENQGPDKSGVYVGQFDSSTGEIRFEARHDRFHQEGEGWTKHDRIYVKCASIDSDGRCEDIEEIHGAASDVFNDTDSGRISTISGVFSEGVRTRFYSTGIQDFNDPEVWDESMAAADQCYILDSATAGDCSDNQGIKIPNSTFFFTIYDGFTPADEWSADVDALDFEKFSLSGE